MIITFFVTILTDGEENASKEYSGIAIKRMIEELNEGNGHLPILELIMMLKK
jgi:hypothetical protein